MTTLEIVLVCALAAAVLGFVGYRIAVWGFNKDEEIEDRRRGAANLATSLSKLGLKKVPEFLIDYSVGDYSGMAHKMAELARLFLEGEAAVLKEFEQVFENVLNARLKDEAGRAYIAAKLFDAKLASDASVVADAPLPATK